MFAGEILKYEALVEDEVYVSRSDATDPKVPAYEGGKFPLSTYLAAPGARAFWQSLRRGARCPIRCASGWRSSNGVRCLPQAGDLLVETFPRAAKYYLVCYPFEGRLAHQTLGMLLTRRLERARLRPLGFVANEYALAVWGLGDVGLAHRARRFLARPTVRRGHAGRRSGGLARRIRADEAHVPQLRDHCRA